MNKIPFNEEDPVGKTAKQSKRQESIRSLAHVRFEHILAVWRFDVRASML